MTSATDLPRHSAFVSRKRLRAASALASTSLLVGFGVAAAMPASAATAADCIDDGTANDNTLSSSAGDDRADIQTLLDGTAAVICLTGTFDIDATLTVSRDIELYGLSSAVLNSLGPGILDMLSSNTIIVENLTFQNGDSFEGGAISGYDVTAINSSFLNNSAFLGGAISAPTVTVENSTFDGNTAGELNEGYGGAIVAEFVSSTDSTFANNFAGNVGGAILAYGAVEVVSSTFVDNETNGDGGAIQTVDIDVTNSTFVGNDAGYEGGAIWAEYGQVTFSTFLNNTAIDPEPMADLPGNAIYVSFNGESSLAIRGNIFAGSSANPQIGVGTIVTPDAITDLAGNIFSTSRAVETDVPNPADASTLFSQSVTAIFGAAPALADNGGPTQTVKIVAGGPAIDAVPPLDLGEAVAPAALEIDVDQRAEPRVGDFVDASAFELHADEIGSESELADTGAADTKVLGGFAALLLGIGAAFAIGTRRLSRDGR